MEICVNSEHVTYDDDFITAEYTYRTSKITHVQNLDGSTKVTVEPQNVDLLIRTERKVPKLGVMLVGWGGNNGSTLTAALLANKMKLSWRTRKGFQEANWYGSITQASTLRLGSDENGDDFFVPLKSMLPMVNPEDLIIDGWDISDLNLYESCKRSGVLEPLLLEQIESDLKELYPRPSIYDQDFIALNQADRANNLIIANKLEQVQTICQDIEDFKKRNDVDKVIVLWTANTERFSDIIEGIHDTAENLTEAINSNHQEISPSSLFAYASIISGCTYINGSPQNTFLPGIIDLAEKRGVFIAGDDFKSGQTKLKSVLVDFLVSAGIKPVCIVSYNHLGNNDGKNLSSPKQFRAKEITKSNVVDDIISSNNILYKAGQKPDHCVVIKYVPYVGDSKRAMDEYTSEIMMGGLNTIVVHNTCEDSLLASPIILDLLILAELSSRIEFKQPDEEDFSKFHPILAILSYLCKAPLVPRDTPIINSLFKQRMCIENILRACLGLPPDNNMLLECKINTLLQPKYE